MENELLIIKSGHQYIRVKEKEYLLCGLDKASVFPMDQIEQVKEHVKQMKMDRALSPQLFRLILREEPFEHMENCL